MESVGDNRAGIVFVRVPGLLAQAARNGRRLPASVPVLVSEGRTIRDVCAGAARRGAKAGMPTVQARRLCPAGLVVPFEEIRAPPLSRRLLDLLADVSPVVEPVGLDSAFADVSDVAGRERARLIHFLRESLTAEFASVCGFAPICGVGGSRLSARACGECDLPFAELSRATILHLWPEEPEIASRLYRLGLATFGDVAAIGESALVFQFGKMGRQLFRRTLTGQDFAPVRALYPPPRADVRRFFTEDAIENAVRLDAELLRLAEAATGQLKALGRFGRRVTLIVGLEDAGEVRREWVTPTPVQDAAALLEAARRLMRQVRVCAPVVSLRLLVEELETPMVQTMDLFVSKAVRERPARIEAARRMLATRYGPQVIGRLSERPLPLREQRRALVRAFVLGAGR